MVTGLTQDGCEDMAEQGAAQYLGRLWKGYPGLCPIAHREW